MKFVFLPSCFVPDAKLHERQNGIQNRDMAQTRKRGARKCKYFKEKKMKI